MPTPVYTPRINNNDDEVRLARLFVSPGAAVRAGEALAEVETDKATFVVEAEQPGFVLAVQGAEGDMIAVGSVLMWLGETPEEAAPAAAAAESAPEAARPPTAKARELLARYGLEAAQVPASGPRLSAQDVEDYVRRHSLAPRAEQAAIPAPPLLAEGDAVELTIEERGMLRSVQWHRDEAVPAYLEVEFDPLPWNEFAARFAAEHKLLLSPLLALVAYQLARYAAATPKVNSTLLGQRRHQYRQVHIGSTVQAGSTLYLAVLRDAAARPPLDFVRAFQNLQRKAMARRLSPEESAGATIGFTSMERWQVSRHIPILPPYVSLMVAHTVTAEGRGRLGATYDHRVLNGADAVAALRHLAVPQPLPEFPALEETT